MDTAVILFLFFINVHTCVKGSVPGTFFWKPRLGLHLVPPFPTPRPIHPPLAKNIHDGLVVILEGYSVGLSVMALAVAYQASKVPLNHLSLGHAAFYTNAYRWGLRHMSMLPYWLSNLGSRYPDTHKVWRRRYYYMDTFVPKWMRYLVPWVKKKEWEAEEHEQKLYTRYAEYAFGKHYRYPEKDFKNFLSEITDETVSNLYTVQESGAL